MSFWQSFWKHWQKEDLSLRLLALAAAVTLWLYASSEPVLEQETLTVQAVPEISGASQELVAAELPHVTIRITGPKRELDKLKGDRLLYVDLAGLGPGTHLVRVQSRVPNNLKVQGITPSQIQVRLLEYAQRRLPVKVEVPNSAAAEATADPETVLVQGAAEDVNKAKEAVVRATGEAGSSAVIVLDEHGRPLSLEVKPGVVSYSVKLSEPVVSKVVPVASTERVTFTPHQVRLWGRADKLQRIEEVLTEPLGEERQGKVSIVVPEGVYAVEPEEVNFVVDD